MDAKGGARDFRRPFSVRRVKTYKCMCGSDSVFQVVDPVAVSSGVPILHSSGSALRDLPSPDTEEGPGGRLR